MNTGDGRESVSVDELAREYLSMELLASSEGVEVIRVDAQVTRKRLRRIGAVVIGILAVLLGLNAWGTVPDSPVQRICEAVEPH